MTAPSAVVGEQVVDNKGYTTDYSWIPPGRLAAWLQIGIRYRASTVHFDEGLQ